jgi:hypothetical protein
MAPNFKSHTKLVKITANGSQDENNPAAGGDVTADLQVGYHFLTNFLCNSSRLSFVENRRIEKEHP